MNKNWGTIQLNVCSELSKQQRVSSKHCPCAQKDGLTTFEVWYFKRTLFCECFLKSNFAEYLGVPPQKNNLAGVSVQLIFPAWWKITPAVEGLGDDWSDPFGTDALILKN